MSKTTSASLPLTVLGAGAITVDPTPEAQKKKQELLEVASMILAVSSEEEQQEALSAAANIKAVESALEKCRKEVKRPILDAGELVDIAAKKYAFELTQERVRIEGLLGAYLQAQREEHEMLMEIQRAEQAAIDAKRVKEEAAQAAKIAAAEKAGKPAPAPLPPPPVPVAVYVPRPTIAGAALREGWDYEVYDIHALYAWNKLFVKCEVDRANFKAYLNMPGTNPETIPGIRAFKTSNLAVQAARPKSALKDSSEDPFQ